MKFQKPVILSLASLLGMGLCAGDVTASLRAGSGFKREDGVKNQLGFGIGYTFDLSKDSHVLVEVGYVYQPGTGSNVAFPSNPLGANIDTSPGKSTNFQKLSNQGFSVRGLYRSTLSGAWSWQAGGMAANLKSRMDAVGDIRDSTTTSGVQAGGWSFNPEKSSLGIGPILGLVYDFGELGNLELNLTGLNTKQVTLTPTFVTGATGVNRMVPVLGTRSVTHVNLEVGVSFRF